MSQAEVRNRAGLLLFSWSPKQALSTMMVWSCGLAALLMSGCGNPGGAGAGSDLDFFERQNAAHDGGYIATYPLSDPDACIARLKEEVPPELQPWGCLSI